MEPWVVQEEEEEEAEVGGSPPPLPPCPPPSAALPPELTRAGASPSNSSKKITEGCMRSAVWQGGREEETGQQEGRPAGTGSRREG